MKLYYSFLLIVCILACCTNSSNVSTVTKIGESEFYGAIHSFTIDEHEYIRIDHGLTHSGDCKKCKLELDSIIREVIKEKYIQ